MIRITVADSMFAYDMFHISKAFCPGETIEQKSNLSCPFLVEIVWIQGDKKCLQIRPEEVAHIIDRKEKKQYVNLKVYDWFVSVTGKELAWGILTGVRPTKLMMCMLEDGCTEEDIICQMMQERRVSSKKAKLGLWVAKKEKELLSQLDYVDGYSLYIGIPFCPTTCSYCSFTSYPISMWQERVDEYLDAVCKELTFVASVSKEKKLNTIYVGGGTPTTLEPAQLDRLLNHLEQHFSYADLKEITVEAGRPDSITKEKLQVLKAHKIGRISINPQTMQQKTLDIIGRKHTVEDVRRVYAMARELGFDNINMDLIAGLPGENVEDMRNTLEQMKELVPDSLTVHALAMKRASKLSQEKKECPSDSAQEAKIASELSEIIEMAADYAGEMQLQPYYLYRQKNIAGNFENVGYAKVDKAGIYNILIMEEKQSIVAVGAGASTKIVLPKGQEIVEGNGNVRKIAHTENVKDVNQYIERIDEMIERKGEWLWR